MVFPFGGLEPLLRKSILSKTKPRTLSRLLRANSSMKAEFRGIVVDASYEVTIEATRIGTFIYVTKVFGYLEQEIYRRYLEVDQLCHFYDSLRNFKILKLTMKGDADKMHPVIGAFKIKAETLILHTVEYAKFAEMLYNSVSPDYFKVTMFPRWNKCQQFLLENTGILSPKKSLTLKIFCGHHLPQMIPLLPSATEVVFDCTDERNWNLMKILDGFIEVAEKARNYGDYRAVDAHIVGKNALDTNIYIDHIKSRLPFKYKYTRNGYETSSQAVLVPGLHQRKHVLLHFDVLVIFANSWKGRVSVTPLVSFEHFYQMFCMFGGRHLNDAISPRLARFLNTVKTDLF